MQQSSTPTLKVNLKDYGYEMSGRNTGSADSLKYYLEQIYEGHLVDEKGTKTEEEKDIIRHKISDLKKEIQEKQGDIRNIEQTKIPENEQAITRITHEIKRIKEDKLDLDTNERFNSFKFSLNLFFLMMLSVYLFFFYVVIIYDALAGSKPKVVGGILPSPEILQKALTSNPILMFAPFILFALGYALHFFAQHRSTFKYLWTPLILLITLGLDWLIAAKILDNINKGNEILGLNVTIWYHSWDFWIILFMGFMIYIIWGVLLHSLLDEWDKKDTSKKRESHINLKLDEMQQNQHKIHRLNEEKNNIETQIEKHKIQIYNYEQDLTREIVSIGDLKQSIARFVTGWLEFLSFEKYKSTREQCIQIDSEFKRKIDNVITSLHFNQNYDKKN